MFKLFSKLISKPFITQAIKFAIVGAIGTIINLTILYTLTEFFHLHYILSEVIAFIVASLNNYILDKIWAFKEKINEKVIKKYFQFILISVLALTINISVLLILVEFFYIWYIFAELVAICFGFFVNFFGNKIFTFKNRIDDVNT